NRLGYAGYIHDRDVATAAHVRYRVYKIDLGRWAQRDPAEYIDGPSLYEFARSSPLSHLDPTGLFCLDQPCGSATITGCTATVTRISSNCGPIVSLLLTRGRISRAICGQLVGRTVTLPCLLPGCTCQD